jgi:hypothetical protein
VLGCPIQSELMVGSVEHGKRQYAKGWGGESCAPLTNSGAP